MMAEYEKRGYLLENFRLFHLRSEGNVKVDYHYHDFCKLLLLVSGSGSYVVDGHRYLLRSGDVIRIGSRSVHCPDLESGMYERIIIYISPEFLQKQSDEGCDLRELFSVQQGHVLRLREQERRKIFAMAADLERELSGGEYGRVILSNAALLRLLVELGRSLRGEGIQSLQPAIAPNPRVMELKQYLDSHLAEDLNIDELAEAFYISKFHMMRLFHREMGLTIYNYLTQRRLLHARDLMGQGMRATEACYRSGFRSYSSFTRAYSKHFGTTPTGRMDSAYERDENFE